MCGYDAREFDQTYNRGIAGAANFLRGVAGSRREALAGAGRAEAKKLRREARDLEKAAALITTYLLRPTATAAGAQA